MNTQDSLDVLIFPSSIHIKWLSYFLWFFLYTEVRLTSMWELSVSISRVVIPLQIWGLGIPHEVKSDYVGQSLLVSTPTCRVIFFLTIYIIFILWIFCLNYLLQNLIQKYIWLVCNSITHKFSNNQRNRIHDNLQQI